MSASGANGGGQASVHRATAGHASGRPPPSRSRAGLLTGREQQVLALLADGLLYKEIADQLGLSYSAVHKYQHRLYQKLRVGNRTEACRAWLDEREIQGRQIVLPAPPKPLAREAAVPPPGAAESEDIS